MNKKKQSSKNLPLIVISIVCVIFVISFIFAITGKKGKGRRTFNIEEKIMTDVVLPVFTQTIVLGGKGGLRAKPPIHRSSQFPDRNNNNPTPQDLDLVKRVLWENRKEAPQDILDLSRKHLEDKYPEEKASSLNNILELYFHYLEGLEAINSPFGEVDLSANMERLKEIRRNFFGSELAQTLFGEGEKSKLLSLDFEKVRLNEELDPIEQYKQIREIADMLINDKITDIIPENLFNGTITGIIPENLSADFSGVLKEVKGGLKGVDGGKIFEDIGGLLENMFNEANTDQPNPQSQDELNKLLKGFNINEGELKELTDKINKLLGIEESQKEQVKR